MIDSRKNEAVRKLFGLNLRNLRQARGYNQLKFSEILGTSQSAVSAWEVGTREPELGVIFEIARTFHVPVTSLIPIEESGQEDDETRKVMEILHNNPRLCRAIERVSCFDDQQLGVVIGVIDAIAKEKEHTT